MVGQQGKSIWVLGATGRVGRGVVQRLVPGGRGELVLVGRTESRLREVAAAAGGARVITVDGVESLVAGVRRFRPDVVLNLLGSYGDTADPLARECMEGGGCYIDLATDLPSVSARLAMHEQASRAGATLVTGCGFGVLATEAVVTRLCAGRPVPQRVCVDAVASWATESGVMGEAFAATSMAVIATGGRCYRDGSLVRNRPRVRPHRLQLPDGTSALTAPVPTAELIAAHHASGARSVDFTSALAPTSPMVRALLPVMAHLVRIPVVRRWMFDRLAATRTTTAPRPRTHSWGHAVIDWPDGTRREGWLRVDDAMDYTADVVAAVAAALLREDAPRGAFTPAAALGAQIAVAAGGQFVDAPGEPSGDAC